MTDSAGVAARWHGWLRARPLVADALLAAALYLVQLGWWAATPREFWDAPPSLVALLGAGEMAFVVIRRRWLWVAAVGLSAYSTAVHLGTSGEGAGGLGLLAIAYTTAAHLALRPAVLAAAVLWLPAVPLSLRPSDRPGTLAEVPWWFFVTYSLLLALICFFVGRVVRSRRAIAAVLADRAAAAAANQRVLTAQAVADERRRIARELHDVVAHHVAVMGVLATGARRVAGRDPAAADEALATVEATGRTALRELRRLLDVLRSDTRAAGSAAEDPAGELAPQPGLAAIEALVHQVREAGLPVTLQVEAPPGRLDAGVALTVYRVVQESLTNVLKHAGTATAEVRITAVREPPGPECLRVEVLDDGRGPVPDADGGHGLVSMRERVHLLRGTLRAGARRGGGFRVSAMIPTETADEPTTTMRAP